MADQTRRVLELAITAAVVLVAEPLFTLADTIVVGHVSPAALAGLGVGSSLMTFVVIVGTFVEYGTTSRAARFFGADDVAGAVNEGVQATWLAIGIGVAVTAVSEVLAHPLTALLAGQNQVTQRTAEEWFRIAVLGVPFMLVMLAGNGWMRGVQETRRPVRIVLVSFGISAASSPLLVYAAGLGLSGSAVANVLAQVIAAGLFLRALAQRRPPRRRLDRRVLWAQLRLGLDLIIRQLGLQFALLSAAGAAARMGVAEVAAQEVGQQVLELTALMLDSFAIAAQSMVGAAIGGADNETARSVAWRVARFGFWAGALMLALLAAGWSLIPAAFTQSPAVASQVHVLWPWLAGIQPVAGVAFALDGVLIGVGDTGYLRTATVASAVLLYTPMNLLAIALHWGIGGIWAAFCLFILARFAAMTLWVRGRRWLLHGQV